MRADKRKKLEAVGFTIGTSSEFLGLSSIEAELIDIRLSLARELRALREAQNVTQAQLADRIGSSQSRVAKMEAGDPSVSIDAMFKSLVSLGASRKQLSKAIAA